MYTGRTFFFSYFYSYAEIRSFIDYLDFTSVGVVSNDKMS